jgi:DNA excision repair protein ERCC-4
MFPSNLKATCFSYLVSYDPFAFYAYLETIVASNSSMANPLHSHENKSPWLTMDAANTIFTVAKRRCYVSVTTAVVQNQLSAEQETEQEADWGVLDEIEAGTSAESGENLTALTSDDRHAWEKLPSWRPWWLPREVEPTLEEQPKWGLLAEILHEIEEDINNNPGSSRRLYY